MPIYRDGAISVRGYKWSYPQYDKLSIDRIVGINNVSSNMASVLQSRGLSYREIPNYLEPSLRNSLPDPSELPDMDIAAKRIATAIINKESICIFGDYDVDGASSSAILSRFLNIVGCKPVAVCIPDRFSDGYGLSCDFVNRIKNSFDPNILLVLDCGTTAIREVDLAKSLSIDVIILDHHIGGDQLPTAALAIVNPNRGDIACDYHYFAAVAVTFMFIVALNRELRNIGYYSSNSKRDHAKKAHELQVNNTKDPTNNVNNTIDNSVIYKDLFNNSMSSDSSNDRDFLSRNTLYRKANTNNASDRDLISEENINKDKTNATVEQNLFEEPNLKQFLDLVALGTVCDVMPLIGANRLFVHYGLKIVNTKPNLGINAMKSAASLPDSLSAYHFGFSIGPMINAGGRLGNSSRGFRILSSNDNDEVEELAKELYDINLERRTIEASVLEEAIYQANLNNCGSDSVVIVCGNEWHEGVIGIVASRLKEKYDRPSVVITISGDVGKASCRSVTGVDIGAAIHECVNRALLIKGGGHKGAAGFSIKKSKVNSFKSFICSFVKDAVDDYLDQRIINIDLSVKLKDLNISVLNDLKGLEPCGIGNPKPRILLEDVTIVKSRIVGATGNVMILHVVKEGSTLISCFVFSNSNSELFNFLVTLKIGTEISLVASIDRDNYSGGIKFIIEDAIL